MIDSQSEGALWTIRLMGPPEASRGERRAHLRSQKTWALLTCLLFPSLHLSGMARRGGVSRETLAERFWGGSDAAPRASLNVALHSLRKAFGSDCLVSDPKTIQVCPGHFTTDIEHVLALQEQARRRPRPSERLLLLIQAAGEIRGEFLDGELRRHDSAGDGYDADEWYQACRAEVHGRMAGVLRDLREELERAGNKDGALETALRAWDLLPEDRQMRDDAQRLARETGRARVVNALDGSLALPDSLARLQEKRERGRRATPREQDRFVALVRERLDSLPEPDRLLFQRLAFLPAPFTAELALAVCQVPARLLAGLAQASLLTVTPGGTATARRYAVPLDIRDAAEHPLCAIYRPSSTTTRQMRRRLGIQCERWMHGGGYGPGETSPPLGNLTEAEPFLELALPWTLEQPATEHRLYYLNDLRFRGLTGLAMRALPYLEAVLDDPKVAVGLRAQAGCQAGYFWLCQNEFKNAVQCLDRARIVLEQDRPELIPSGLYWHATIYEYLTLATHYAGDSRKALRHLDQAIACFARIEGGDGMEIGNYQRMRCEIQITLGEYHDALQAADEAVRLRSNAQTHRGIEGPWAPVADALFWKALTLCRLQQSAFAADCLLEALDIWQRTGDKTGSGHCLRELAALYAEEGRFIEARAHLEHAIALHEGSAGCRNAACTVLADVLCRQGNWNDARKRYTECLRYAEETERHDDACAYRDRLAMLTPRHRLEAKP